jgi:CheY-like chemotaxis protein
MNEKLLLVDDNKHLRVTLGDHLTHEGFVVTAKESAEAALVFLESGGEPDLIILDINMPGIGGVGFLRRILSEDGRPRYPVLVLTARSGMDAFFDTVPVEGFLPKPCGVDELLAKIREILARTSVQRPRAAASDGLRTKAATENLVLLAEDDPIVSESIERLLRSIGCRTVIVRTGPEVLEAAAQIKPRLVILKQLMPKLNGNVVAPALAGMPSTRQTPILLYDESRRLEDPGIFGARLPSAVTRYVASNRAVDLLRAAQQLLAAPQATQTAN